MPFPCTHSLGVIDIYRFHSIIKERRAMSNFQLIVITHDEKFLEKLGQADVMEYYWCDTSFIHFFYPVLKASLGE